MSRTSKSRTEDFDLDNFRKDLVFEVLYMRTARTRSNTSSSTTSRTSSSSSRAEDVVLDVEDDNLIVFISFV